MFSSNYRFRQSVVASAVGRRPARLDPSDAPARAAARATVTRDLVERQLIEALNAGWVGAAAVRYATSRHPGYASVSRG